MLKNHSAPRFFLESFSSCDQAMNSNRGEKTAVSQERSNRSEQTKWIIKEKRQKSREEERREEAYEASVAENGEGRRVGSFRKLGHKHTCTRNRTPITKSMSNGESEKQRMTKRK